MIPFDEIGRLPAPMDNVAIATRRLEAGTEIVYEDNRFCLTHTVLEGHRFAVQTISAGAFLTSWEMPFGTALQVLAPGTYVCNRGVLEALQGRSIDFTLPDAPNFSDDIPSFVFEPSSFRSERSPVQEGASLYFQGYDRGPARGAGTRNFIVVIGLSSRVAGFVRKLAQTCRDQAAGLPEIDGVVPVAHTEGDDARQLNKDLLLRALAGFMVHPNVGGALIVGHESASITIQDLQTYLKSNAYPVDDVIHDWLTFRGAFKERLAEGQACIGRLVAEVGRMKRTPQPVSHLKIALQCGGSDAFSGISGNPLAGWVAKEVIARGGSANLAETDELIGAESYVLKRARSEAVVQRFLHVIQRFQERAHRHGSSAAGNPSGGNKFRGLYNIYLKSLGAAMKRHPDVRLDDVIDYGARMTKPGYYFMDSPGNDLESISGQVASGCNMIFFVTGNGSITNFPFVPTLKFVTTTRRYALLADEMDVNAGAYLEGVSMDVLGARVLNQMIDIASGEYSAGELAGHAQVQLWRNWKFDEGEVAGENPGEKYYAGIPVKTNRKLEQRHTVMTQRFGLILPTSLCSGQISSMAVDRLNASPLTARLGITRFANLVHTEGCGASSGASEQLFLRTLCGHLTHPDVTHALLLEHGCEKTHNDFFRNHLSAEGADLQRFGWASIQQDGGIDRVIEKIQSWFASQPPAEDSNKVGVPLCAGLIATEKMSDKLLDALIHFARRVLDGGGSIVLPSSGRVDHHLPLYEALGMSRGQTPTLNYGQKIYRHGLHIMAAPTWHYQELVAGLGAAGVNALIGISDQGALPVHPFVASMQVGTALGEDDIVDWHPGYTKPLLETVGAIVSGQQKSLGLKQGHFGIQVSRGWTGISL